MDWLPKSRLPTIKCFSNLPICCWQEVIHDTLLIADVTGYLGLVLDAACACTDPLHVIAHISHPGGQQIITKLMIVSRKIKEHC